MKRYEALLALGLLFLTYANTQVGLPKTVGLFIGIGYLGRAMWNMWINES